MTSVNTRRYPNRDARFIKRRKSRLPQRSWSKARVGLSSLALAARQAISISSFPPLLHSPNLHLHTLLNLDVWGETKARNTFNFYYYYFFVSVSSCGGEVSQNILQTIVRNVIGIVWWGALMGWFCLLWMRLGEEESKACRCTSNSHCLCSGWHSRKSKKNGFSENRHS